MQQISLGRPIEASSHIDNSTAPTIIIIPTGLLGLLPLRAAGKQREHHTQCFLDKYVVAYAPSAYSLYSAGTRRAEIDRRESGVLAIIDPTGDRAFGEVVADALVAYFGEDRSQLLVRPSATQAAVAERLSSATYLHFDCHGYYNPEDVLHSGLQLAQDDPLELDEILSPTFDLSATHLVTLSACETGLTEFEDIPDEEIGLPAGFMQAGALAVVSSLWAVEEFSAALLMREFYHHHIVKGYGVAAALRCAQLWLRGLTVDNVLDMLEPIRGKAETANHTLFEYADELYWRLQEEYGEGDRPFADPYYWGAFVASGLVA